MRRVKAVSHYYLFARRDNNGIYLADGFVAKLEYPLHESSIENAAAKFESLRETYFADTDARLYYSIVPDKNYFLAAQNGYPSMDYERLLALMAQGMQNFSYIDLFPYLTIDDYYRTDTHWRQADTLVYRTNPILEGCTVYSYESGKTTPVYDAEKLSGKDPYDVFLSGAAAILRVDTPAAESDRELVVFRDSFGSSITPLLIPAYARVTLIDIRYVKSELLGELLDLSGTDDVLFLYSTMVLNNSTMLK